MSSFAERILNQVKPKAAHREIHFHLEGEKDLYVFIPPGILEEILEGLLKNAIENTPDEGVIAVSFEKTDHEVLLKVEDFGVGITEENQKLIFGGLFHTQETDLYSSGRPYDFNAGGKGLRSPPDKSLWRALWLRSLSEKSPLYLYPNEPGSLSRKNF